MTRPFANRPLCAPVLGSLSEFGLLSAAYQLGYRAALLVTDAVILISATHVGWPISYAAMAVLMGVGLCSLVATEPARPHEAGARTASLWTPRGFADAVIGPFAEFFRVYGWLALLMLAVISLYRLPEFMMGPMANPFYHDLGLSKESVGAVRGSIGLTSSLLGIAAGGFCALRFGHLRTLVAGVILQSLVIAAFAILAWRGPDLTTFGAVMAADSFGVSFAGVALVTYMSSLTSLGYTATQYALLSSAYTYVGKVAKGFSGVIVEHLADGRTLMGRVRAVLHRLRARRCAGAGPLRRARPKSADDQSFALRGLNSNSHPHVPTCWERHKSGFRLHVWQRPRAARVWLCGPRDEVV